MKIGDLVWVYMLDEYHDIDVKTRYVMKLLTGRNVGVATVQINPEEKLKESDKMTVYTWQIRPMTEGELMLYKLEVS